MDKKPLHIAKPKWLKTKIPTGKTYAQIKENLRSKTYIQYVKKQNARI